MVALRWCEDDEAEQQQELVGCLPVAAGNPSRWQPRLVQLAPPEVPYSDGRAASAVRRRPRTFFWRRAVAVLVIVGLGALAWSVTGTLVSAGAEAPQSQQCLSSGAPGEGQTAGSCGQVYVARPGDTIWAIAVAYSRGSDPRPLVAKLESEIGGGELQPGERLTVP
jgi:hypothetical protein